ncbi:MAG: NUDIX hydrolase [Candidatus Aenigmarchaeota archaeon]|nr:NUDIX hydrolase [Candidatus Aenigmarchaeota archaeon]
MSKLYKDGYLEAVVFVFYKDGKILVEKRSKKGEQDVFIPSGGVEQEDAKSGDYLVNALKREISEELQGKIEIIEYKYLTSCRADAIKINFHAFVITKWKGSVPDFTVEDGKRFADLFWISLSEYEKYLKFPSAVHLCEELKRFIEER